MRVHREPSSRIDGIARAIVDCAIEVHRELGPGLLESAYAACLAYLLLKRGHVVQLQVPVPLRFREVELEVAYRLDMLVDDAVVVELKTVEVLTKRDQAQLLTYLKLTGKQLGFLINFDSVPLKEGIQRLVRMPSS